MDPTIRTSAPRGAKGSVADAGDLAFAQLIRLVAERGRILDQLLLNLRVLLEQRLLTQQEAFEGQGFHVVALERKRLVGRLQPLLDVIALLRVVQPDIALRLVPVVAGDRMERLRAVGCELA